MSDYLWDKTGTRDAEVERLESLLGQLRHRPRPLELPDELTATRAHNAAASFVGDAETTRAPSGAHALNARRRFRTSWLAVAAALLLAFVALALALLRTDATGGGQQSAAQVSHEHSRPVQPQQLAVNQPQNAERRAATSPAQVVAPPSQENVTDAGAAGGQNVQVAVNSVAKENRKERQSALAGRQLAFVAKRQPAQLSRVNANNTGGLTPASHSSSPDDLSLKARLAAKEQLMYALRLTSLKLSEVRAKTSGLGDARQGFVEGNRIK